MAEIGTPLGRDWGLWGDPHDAFMNTWRVECGATGDRVQEPETSSLNRGRQAPRNVQSLDKDSPRPMSATLRVASSSLISGCCDFFGDRLRPGEQGGMMSWSRPLPQRWGCAVLSVLSLSMILPPTLGGQALLKRDPGIGTIEFARVVAFGDVEGPGYIGLPAQVVRRHNGDWVATDQINQAEIKVFSADGEWIRAIGRSGEGPGEFVWALDLYVEADDGLRVFDPALQRITDFDSSLEVRGTITLKTPPMGLTFLPEGLLVGMAQLNGPDQIGLPLHFLGSDGGLIRSFGADPPIREWDNPHKAARRAAPSGSRAVWSAHLTEYELERWTVEGVRTHWLVGNVPWFEPHDRVGMDPDQSRPPNPGIYRIHVDQRGLVWLGIRVPDPNWRDGLVRVPGQAGGTRLVSTDDNLAYDTVLEVIDPARGVVVASGRHASAIWAFTNEGHLVFHRFLEDGTPVCEVWRAQF